MESDNLYLRPSASDSLQMAGFTKLDDEAYVVCPRCDGDKFWVRQPPYKCETTVVCIICDLAETVHSG